MKYLSLLLFLTLGAHASIKISTFNIRNFDKSGSQTNKSLLKSIILEVGPDLMAVQEIHNERSFKEFTKSSLKGYGLILSRCGGGGRQKLGFLFKKSKLKLISSREDTRVSNAFLDSCDSLRPAMVSIFEENSSKRFAAISVHLKAGSGSRNYARRATQYDGIADIIRELNNKGLKRVVALGDFNTTGFDLRDNDYKNFIELLHDTSSSTSAHDISCTSYWRGRDYSDGIEEASTLDHIVYTNSFGKPQDISVGSHCKKAKCKDTKYYELGESYRSVSDHCPVSAIF